MNVGRGIGMHCKFKKEKTQENETGGHEPTTQNYRPSETKSNSLEIYICVGLRWGERVTGEE